MLHHLGPERDVIFEVFLVGVRKWTHVEIEAVAVVWNRDGCILSRRSGWLGSRNAESSEESEPMWQVESSVVVEVVANEPIGNRRLRRRGNESRVGIN